MNKDIVAKLNKHLEQPVDSECSALYLVAEVRKLLEQNQPKPRPFALWMYCHWALHVNLNGETTTLHFLDKVDKYVVGRVAGFNPTAFYSFVDEHQLFREFLYLDTFRDELASCLRHFGIRTDLVDNDGRWFRFLEAYGGIVEDGELTAGKGGQLQAIEKVLFKKGEPLPPEYHVPFTIQWDILLKDKRAIKAEVKAIPQTMMFMHAISVIPAR